MLRKNSPFAILSLFAFILPFVLLGMSKGGDRTGDMAGMGALLLIFAFGIGSILGLILAVLSFVFREKLRILSLAGLLPLPLLILFFRMKASTEAIRQKEAQALVIKWEAECLEWYEKYRTTPERLLSFDPRTADNSQRCAFEMALSTQPLELELELLSRLFEGRTEVQGYVLKHPKIDAQFLMQRFPEARRQSINRENSPLEFMVRHPALPADQLREIATNLEISDWCLVIAREEYRRRAGMTQDQIRNRSRLDYTGDAQPPGDVLPPIPSNADRQKLDKEVVPQNNRL